MEERLFSKGKLACHYRKAKVRDSQHPCSWPLGLTHSFPGPPSFHLVPPLQDLHLLTCAEKPYLPDLSMTGSYTSDLHSNATLSERPSWTPRRATQSFSQTSLCLFAGSNGAVEQLLLCLPCVLLSSECKLCAIRGIPSILFTCWIWHSSEQHPTWNSAQEILVG